MQGLLKADNLSTALSLPQPVSKKSTTTALNTSFISDIFISISSIKTGAQYQDPETAADKWNSANLNVSNHISAFFTVTGLHPLNEERPIVSFFIKSRLGLSITLS